MKKQSVSTMLSVVTVAAVVCLAGGAAAIVSPQGTTYLEVTPVDDFEPSGMVGGPFTPSSMDYQLTNIGPNSLWWGVYETADWLNAEPEWGPLAPSQSITVAVSLTSEANSLSEGIYTDTLTFIDISNDQQQTRTAILSVIAPGNLEVTPSEDFEPSGPMGGPFTPPSKQYQLTNNGGSSISWSVDKTADWLDADPNEGVLNPSESIMITAGLNALANSLLEDIYTDTLIFTDVTNDCQQSRGVTLSIGNIWLSPGRFNIDIVEGRTLTETLTIENEGPEDFDFTIRTRQLSGSGQSAGGIAAILAARRAEICVIPEDRDFTVAGDAPYEPGELIVRFAPRADGKQQSGADKKRILNSIGVAGKIKRDFLIVPGLSVVELPAEMTVEEALQIFNEADDILYAQPNYEVHAISTLPDDARFDELWGMHNTGQTGGTEDADIDAPEAWDITTGSGEIVVAVIDTGVDYTHPDLAANMWVNEVELNGIGGVDDDGNGYVDDIYGYDFRNNDGDPMDDHYHGTHCAGTIGAVGNNGEGVAGVNWNVRIMAVKFLSSGGSGSAADAISGIEYSVLMGANLSSNSWGGGDYNQALKDAIEAAAAAGMLFVAAAGNDNDNTDDYPHYPSSYDSEGIISVMSTQHNDNKSSFSNWGPVSVDLGAPGSDILSCKLGGGYKYLNGTSMATTPVAGACALLWSTNPAMSSEEVKDILLRTVDPILPGLCVSEGRLNLYNAILETKAPWLHINPEAGTVSPANSMDISVTFDASELAPGTYKAEIVIFSDDPSSPRIVPVTMTVSADDLAAAPAEGFEASGTEGGPFEPQCKVYTLTNNGTESVNWTTLATEDWLAVDPCEGMLGPDETIEVNVCISPDANLLDPNIYTDILMFQNTDSGSIKPRTISLTVKPPDCFSEAFGDGGNDLNGLMLTFSPDGSIAYYQACREEVDGFGTDPNGGRFVALWDDDFVEVVLSDDANVLFYGSRYDRFYIGSNGYITFGAGDTEYAASLEHHFALPRISVLFADLTPPNNQCISYRQLEDRVAVTFENVPLYGDKTSKNSFQVEIFFADGTICITWLDTAATPCVAGLSRGKGLPPAFFAESDLSEYIRCCPFCDFDRDYSVDMSDLAIFVSHWLDEDCDIPYWCGQTDIDRSRAVDFADFAICADNWLLKYDWWLGPVSHWKFDEGQGDIAYDSAGSNDGTIYGALWTAGKIGHYALDFDGDGDYVEIPDNSLLTPHDKITISYWLYKRGGQSAGIYKYAGCPDEGSSPGNSRAYYIEVNDSTDKVALRIFSSVSNYDTIESNNAVSLNQWYHIAATFDQGQAAIYIDGQLDSSTTMSVSSIMDDVQPLIIGAFWKYCGGDNFVSNLNGKIDDVRIYDRALSEEEIQQLYREGIGNKAFNPNPADGARGVDPNGVLSWSPGESALSHDVYFGTDYDDVNDATPDSNEYMGNYDANSWDPNGLDLETTYYWRIDELDGSNTYKGDVWSFKTWVEPNFVGWWEFEEGQGNIAYDSAGNNNGTIYGAQWTAGKTGDYALNFDGGNDYVETDNGILNLPMGDHTIAVWTKIDGIYSSGIIVHSGQTQWWQISYASSASRYYAHWDDDVIHTIVSSNGPPSVGEWTHIAMRRSGNEYSMFIDGVKQNDTEAVNNDFQVEENIFMGKCGSTYFDGTIDDVRIYDRALSAEEIQQLYQAGLN